MKGLSFAKKFGQKIYEAVARGLAGDILARRGDPAAEKLLKKSIEVFRSLPGGRSVVGYESSLLAYGKLLFSRDKKKALPYINEAVEVLSKRDASPNVTKNLAEARELLEELGEETRAKTHISAEKLEEYKKNLKKILDVSKSINSETEMDNVLGLALDAALQISGAERGFIVLIESDLWKTTLTKNFIGDITEDPDYSSIQEIIQNTLSRGAPFIESDIYNSTNFKNSVSKNPGAIKAAFAFPLMAGKEILGCIYLDSRFVVVDFPKNLEDLMKSVMEHAAFVIAKTSQYERVRGLSEKLEHKVERQNIELRKTRSELEKKQQELEFKHHYKNIISKSSKMREIFRLLDEITGNDLPVSIEGASGTGKELVAKAIHFSGPRKKKSFVAINCAAIPESLMESELFGYEKGAFTGADERKAGIFEQANGGTLFLDEIGNMSPVMQQKLLRVVQENEVRRIGSDSPVKVDVRIISATNRSLSDLVAGETFREDLFYRLSVLPIILPPLRDRKEDIPLLVEYFWKKISPYTEIPENDKGELLKLLNDYDWPGNVRELENEITRLASLGKTGFNIKYLSRHILHESQQSGVPMGIFLSEESLTLPEIEKRCIVAALEKEKGNKTKAAKILGIPRTSIDSKMKKLNIRLAELVYEY
jgi:transcriptional regulator with GAF, ATPase, and Fis domain